MLNIASKIFKISEVEISNNDTNETNKAHTDENAPEQFSPAEASLLEKAIRKGLVENKNDIEIQRRDPSSPLYSVKTFEALRL